MGDRICNDGFDITILPTPSGQPPLGPPHHAHWAVVDWVRDAEETRAVIEATSPDWLVLGHYAFDARWQAPVRYDRARLMVIDDLADRHRNHSIGTAVMQLECSAWPSASNSTGVIHPAG
jgi:UDP-2,4-diacetamido-2,4,6-trideoxy-beta-L-altropyranose hydrolase